MLVLSIVTMVKLWFSHLYIRSTSCDDLEGEMDYVTGARAACFGLP